MILWRLARCTPALLAVPLLATSCGAVWDKVTNGAAPSTEPLTTVVRPVASPFEVPLLADGQVSRAELDLAHNAVVSCMLEHGVNDTGAGYRPPWTLGVEASPVRPGSMTGEAVGAITQQCHDTHFGVVSSTFLDAHRPSEADEQRLRAAIGACLNDAGLAVTGDVSTLSKLLQRYGLDNRMAACRESAERNWS